MTPEIGEQILAEVRELKHWLYGVNGFEGDIPAIKKQTISNNKRITRLEITIAGLVGSGILGGGIWMLFH